MPATEHIPALFAEAISYLDPKPGGVYVDATVGTGGHAIGIAERIGPNGTLIGVDIDPDMLSLALKNLEKYKDRVVLYRGSYADLDKILFELGFEKIDGILFDLGVSSPHLEDPERGFSFKYPEARLDMRYDRERGITAEYVLNRFPRGELEKIFRNYGEERFAYRIAREIARRRQKEPIRTVGDLLKAVMAALPPEKRTLQGRIHPATKVFLSLRAFVNREYDNLREGLAKALKALKPGGRIVVISFHSIEDRIVKRFFEKNKDRLKILTPSPVTPTEEEISFNPRARSAKLRAAEKTGG